VGIASWIASGVVAFVFARIVPPGRSPRWLAELVTSLLIAIALGLTATALDFGGWREPEPRAALLIVCGSFAAIGLLRLLRLARRKHAAW
jgi:predicted MFS family arabinose efflux permease